MIPQLHLHAQMKGVEENIRAGYGRRSQVRGTLGGRAPSTENTADLRRDS